MEKKITFRAVIERARNGGAFVTVPFDVEAIFGKKRVKVKATIEGIPYRGSLVRMGGPDHILGILKKIREETGKQIGDEVEIVVEEDTGPRAVTVPHDVTQALADAPGAGAFFEKLAYSHQKAYIDWIEAAKRSETRERRIVQMVEMLKQGKRRR